MLTTEQQVTNWATMQHIERVRNLLNRVVVELLHRAEEHDQSKLRSPEVEVFTEFTPLLADLTYGSPEFNECKRKMAKALEHHYAKNAHHPEHHANCKADGNLLSDAELILGCRGLPKETADRVAAFLRNHHKVELSSIGNMSLIDILEMLVDWKASSERHHDGNILKSIEVNTDRFGISPQLARVLENTAKQFLEGA